MSVKFLIGLFCLTCCIAPVSGQQPSSGTPTKARAPLDVGVEIPDVPEERITLPDLLLKCQGHVTEGFTNVSRFDAILKLTDGKLSDTLYSTYSISGCVYQAIGRGIQCLERAVSKSDKGYELREQRAFIARATGEYSHYLEIRSLKTKDDIGSLKRVLERTGVCSANQPIF